MSKKILTPTGWKSLNESVKQTEVVKNQPQQNQQKTEGLDLDGMLDYIFENHFEDVVLDYLDIVEAAKKDRNWLDAEKAAEKDAANATKGDKPAHWMTSGRMVQDAKAKSSIRSDLSKSYADFFKKGGKVTLVKGRKMRKEEFEIDQDDLVEFILMNYPTIVEKFIVAEK
jgi:hypothetical protein